MTVRQWSMALLILALSWPGLAGASGFFMAKFGGDLGYPTSFSAVSVYWNPAAMAYEPGSSILLESSVLYRRIDYERTMPGVDAPSNTGDARLRNWVVLPYIGMKSNFGLENVAPGLENIAFGVAAYPAYGMKTAWTDTDGPQRWQTISGNLVSWYVTAAVGIRLPKNFCIGFSLSYVRTDIETLRATNLVTAVDPGSFQVNVDYVDDPAGEGRTLVDVAANDVAYSIGWFWEPLEGLRLGMSYMSSIDVDASGSVTSVDHRGNVSEHDGSLTGTFPDSIHLGIEYYPIPQVGLRFGLSWVQWSLFDKQVLTAKNALGQGNHVVLEIPREYHDTFIIRGGVKYSPLDWLTIYVGAGWDQSPVPTRGLEGSLFDLDKVGVSGGLVLDPFKHMRLTLGYNHIFHLSETVSDSKHEPSANGTYSSVVDLIHGSVEFMF